MTSPNPAEPFVVGVIDSGIHGGHPHIGAVVEGAGFDSDRLVEQVLVRA